MLAGLFAATDASGPPAAAPPPRTPGSDCARLNNGKSIINRNRANGHVRRAIEPPPLRVERENRTDTDHTSVAADATATGLLPEIVRKLGSWLRCGVGKRNPYPQKWKLQGRSLKQVVGWQLTVVREALPTANRQLPTPLGAVAALTGPVRSRIVVPVLLLLLLAPIARADVVRILDDDREAMQARADIIRQAKGEISLLYFLARDDRVTLAVLALLREAKHRGVGDIRLIVDGSFQRIPKPV